VSDVCLSDVCLSRTSGLSREQSQWAGGLLSLAYKVSDSILWRPPAQLAEAATTTSYLGHNVFVVVVSQSAAEFVVVHIWFALALSPPPSDLVWVGQFELARSTVPCDARRVHGVGQKLQQELPQLDLPASCTDVTTQNADQQPAVCLVTAGCRRRCRSTAL